MSNFIERLQELMFERVDAKTLGEAIGTSASNIHRWLKSEYSPSLDYLIRIADYFGCSLEYLCGRIKSEDKFPFKVAPKFSAQLEFILKFFDKTEYKVVKATGISRSVFDNWKTGKYLPQLDNLLVLANYFNCTLDFLVGRED